MKYLKLVLLNLAFMLLLFETTWAQLPKMNVTAPTAASLIKFVDIPVNYHTGIPNVSIPIHTVNEGSLSLPITLSYHAGGLKVMEQASWVGAGWSLEAGGVITRTPRGLFDELENGHGPYLNGGGYYAYYTNNNGSEVVDFNSFADGFKDGEPDLFFFNFNGYSGKFYFRADTTIMLEGSEDLLVRAKICQQCTAIEKLYGFTIITPNGDKYYFGKTTDITNDVDPLEWTRSFATGSGGTFAQAPTSWYLHKIESADGNDVINLQYANENYAFFNIATFSQTNLSSGSNGITLVKQRIDGVRLNKILSNSNLDTVNFIANDSLREDLADYHMADLNDDDCYHPEYGARALKKIRIRAGSLCKVFVFEHNYFFDNSHPILSNFEGMHTDYEVRFNLHTDKKRLKLKSLQEITIDSSIALPPHKFYYYQDNEVPRALSLGQDHWGYYNGHHENRYLIPPFSINGGTSFYSGLTGNRESSWPAMRAGTLREIQYPIGGRTEIVYGHHASQGTKFIQTGTTSSSYTLTPSKWNRDLSTTFTSEEGSVCTLTISVNGTSYSDFYCGPQYFNTSHVGTNEFILPAGTYTFSAHCTDPDTGSPSYSSTAVLTITKPVGYIGTVPYDVGGLRVDTLKTYESSTVTPMVTTFDYTNYGENTGVLFSVPVYVAQLRNDIAAAAGIGQYGTIQTQGFYMDANQTKVDYSYSPGSIHPMQTSSGAHFGYGQVKVIQPDGGYIKYFYNTHSNNLYSVPVTTINVFARDFSALNWPPAPDLADPDRGALERTEIYDASGRMLKLIKSERTYTVYPEGITAFLVKSHGPMSVATEYEIKRNKKTFERTTELIFDQLDSTKPPKGIVSESFYNSAHHSMLTQQTEYEMTSWNQATLAATKGKVLSDKKYTYVADLKIPACYNTYTAYSTLTNSLNSALSTFNDVRYHTGVGNPELIHAAWQTYAIQVNNARKTYVTNRRAYYYGDGGTNRGYGSFCETNTYYYTPADANTKAVVDLKVRNNIEPVLETSSYRDGKFLGSSVVTYKMYNNNRRQIFPNTYHVFNTSLPGDPSVLTGLNIQSGTTYTKDSDYKLEATYSFNSSGLQSEVVAKDGVTTSYKWGYDNRYPIAQIVNATDAQVYYNSFEESSQGGTTGTAVTGTKYLNSGTFSLGISLPAGPVYKMSYWYYDGAQGKWLFSGELPYSASISSGGTRLDEVRVYPQGAMMTTYAYTEGYGVSQIIDPNNKMMTYTYDKLGRVIVIKDHDGKVLQSYQYHYKDQPSNAY